MANVKITDLTSASTPLAGSELLEIVQGGASRKVAASDIAASATNVRTVATGGTGAATLTGFVKGNGTSAMTAVATVSLTTEVTGTLPVANGGTGAATLTGYVKGSGTSAMTASATVPFGDVSGRAFIAAVSTADQTGNVSAGTAVTFNTGTSGTGINILASTQVTFTDAGTYLLAPRLQFRNSDANDHDATIWFRKNGTNIANSATVVTVPKVGDGGIAFFQVDYYEPVTAGQYIEIMWLPENVSVTLDATVAGAIAPAIPSAVLSSQRIA